MQLVRDHLNKANLGDLETFADGKRHVLNQQYYKWSYAYSVDTVWHQLNQRIARSWKNTAVCRTSVGLENRRFPEPCIHFFSSLYSTMV